MKIKDNRKNTVHFKELRIGGVCEIETEGSTKLICMKIPIYSDSRYNAVKLSDGGLMFVDTDVIPLKATLHIDLY